VTRRLLNLLTALSLLLCVAVVALWVRSYWRYDLTGARLGGAVALVGSYRGHLLWAAELRDEHKGAGEWYGHDSGGRADAESTWQFLRTNAAFNVLGFSYTGDVQTSMPLRVMVTPSWSAALVLAFLPGRRLAHARRRRRRRNENRCAACGYDLTGNVSGVCPECGESSR